jgi:hypothetical protein
MVKEEKCGDCAHGETKLIKGEDTGFVLCEFTSRAHWYAGRLPCQLTPPRYERRADQREGTPEGSSHGG